MRRRRWPLVAIALVALLLLVGRAVAGVYVDYLWYDAMHAAPLWRERAWYTVLLSGGSGVLFGAFVFANLYAVRHSVVSLVLPRRVANIEIGEEVPGRYLVGSALLLSALMAWVLALPAESWRMLALIRHGASFNETDPYFDAPLGFFVYWLPLEDRVHFYALMSALLVSALVIFFYALTPSLRWERGQFYVSNYVRRHLVVLGTVLLLLLAWSYRLQMYETLLDGSGPDGAFTFADHRAVIPLTIWLSFLTVGAAFVVFFFGWTGQVRVAGATIITLVVLSLALEKLAPALVRRSEVSGSAARESSYARTRAEYTRRAFALDRVRPGEPALLVASLRAATNDVAAWDAAALLRASVRPGHTEGVLDGLSWRPDSAGLTAVLPVRPVPRREEELAAPWSVARVLASSADPSGDPVPLPSPGTTDTERIEDVLIADSAAGYAWVVDSAGRIPAPALDSPLSRLAHAWALQNFRLVFGDLPRPVVRIITHRDVRERVGALAPYFLQGRDIIPLVAADSLYWALDLYAWSRYYPLSRRDSVAGEADISYLHHAALAVVSAQTGRTLLIADSTRDPISQSWVGRFAGQYASPAALPPAIARALPPAIDGALAQARAIARYGLRNETPRGGALPDHDGADSLLESERETYFALPTSAALAWSTPILDSAQHVAGLALATGGADRATHWLPFAQPGPRWSSVVDQLRRALDSTASVPKEETLVHGAVRPLPVTGGAAFVQSAYTAHAGTLSLQRVAALVDTVVSTGRTLADVTGAPGPLVADTTSLAPRDLRARAARLYDDMRAALQRGDWAAFGRAYEALGHLLGVRERRP